MNGPIMRIAYDTWPLSPTAYKARCHNDTGPFLLDLSTKLGR